MIELARGCANLDVGRYFELLHDIRRNHDAPFFSYPREHPVMRFLEDVEGFSAREVSDDEVDHAMDLDHDYGWVLLYPKDYVKLQNFLKRMGLVDFSETLHPYPMLSSRNGKTELIFEKHSRSLANNIAVDLDFEFEEYRDDNLYDELERQQASLGLTPNFGIGMKVTSLVGRLFRREGAVG